MDRMDERLFLSISDFFRDDEFISWRLFRTKELDEYWSDFLKKNPASKELLQNACQQFEVIRLNRFSLTSEMEMALYERIHNRILIHEKNKKSRIIFWFSTAASIILIIFSVFFLEQRKISEADEKFSQIVGKTLPSKKIQLITENEIIDLESHSFISITNEGKASVIDDKQSQRALNLAENKLNKLIVPYGQRSFITLVDGTEVWLNSGTQLDFPTYFTDSTRNIQIRGEIFIDVAKSNKPFIVQTEHTTIRVLGTKFNITAYEESALESVVLVEGSIQIITGYQQSTTLFPNEMATISADKISKSTVDVSEYTSWRNGLLQFNNTSMTEVLKKVGRYYNISFESTTDVSLEKKIVSGKLFLSNNIDSVMTSVSVLSSTDYIKENDHIIIRKHK